MLLGRNAFAMLLGRNAFAMLLGRNAFAMLLGRNAFAMLLGRARPRAQFCARKRERLMNSGGKSAKKIFHWSSGNTP